MPPSRKLPQASIETILADLWKRIDRKIETRVGATLEQNYGGLVQGGFLNAGMLAGSIPAREVIHNASGGAIDKAQAVYVTGEASGLTTVAKARANADATMPALGLLADDVLNGADGVMIRVGRITGIDTSAWAVNAALYVSSATAGELTDTAPAARAQIVAIVARSHATLGSVEVVAGSTARTLPHTHSDDDDGGDALTPQSLDMGGNPITGVDDPSNAQDAATKAYVDANGSAGLSWKASVRVATTATGTLATAFENGDTVDGVVLATGDRILIKNQSAGAENGIYVVAASGAPTRATDFDTGAKALGAVVKVNEGTANADSIWQLTTNATITIGSTSLIFVNLAGGGLIWSSGQLTANIGSGLDVAGNVIQLNTHSHASDGVQGGRALLPGVLAPEVIYESGLTSGAVNAWDPDSNFSTNGGATIIIDTASGPISLNGMVAAPSNGPLWVMAVNFSGQTITIAAESGSATAARRFATPSGLSFSWLNLHTIWLSYQSLTGVGFRWVVAESIPNHAHNGPGAGDTLSNAAIASGAEIAVSKLADGDALALLRTASNGTDVEWGSAGQIVFPATQNASADANTLDDYEHGTYTPVVDQGASTNIAKTVTAAHYTKVGASVDVNLRLDMTAAGTAGAQINITYPFTSVIGAFTFCGLGAAQIYDASAGGGLNVFAGTAIQASTAEFTALVHGGNGNAFGVSPNIAIASGDVITAGIHIVTA